MKKPELLAPAGNMEKLDYALAYGADAVYLSGKEYGLRAFADNFSREELAVAVDKAHRNNSRAYITVNIFPKNADLEGLPEYLNYLKEIAVDAIICADPGIIGLAKKHTPDLPIHLSTQANTTNWASADFWETLGIKRIVLARELSLQEIIEIKEHTALDIETFIHGAMCMSYSGRCLISNYLTGRDANKGECAQPCRWNYSLCEEKRPGEYYPIFEDERGTYIFNSQDLCLINHLPQLIEAGIDSFKIEGRMKSAFYVATVVSAYRKAIDEYFEQKAYPSQKKLQRELDKISHRPYTTGFYFAEKDEQMNIYSEDSAYIREYEFIGRVLSFDKSKNLLCLEQRNNFKVGEKIELMEPHKEITELTITQIFDENGNSLDCAPHPKQKIFIPCKNEVSRYALLRREGAACG